MEDVVDLYEEPYDPDRPVVCFDETSKQLTADKSPGIPAKPGQAQRYDYEYKRNGTRNLFMFCEPLRGWRHLEVTERRTAQDFAHQMKWLVDEAYPEAQVVRLVLDNLNTHKLGSLYETHTPAEADASPSAWSFITPQNMAAGSTWRRSSSAFSVDNVSTVESATNRSSSERLQHSKMSATEYRPPSNGDSRSSTPDSNFKHVYPSHSD